MITDIIELLRYIWFEGIVRPASYLVDPARRISIFYLFISLLIALSVYKISFGKTISESFKILFSRKIWLSESAKIDYFLYFIIGIFKAVFVLPFLSFGILGALKLGLFLSSYTGAFRLPVPVAAVAYPIILFLVKDFFVYLTHYALHRVPILWEFHKVHHSAETMTPFTLYRLHPVEMIINNFQGMAAFILVTGLFDAVCDVLPGRALFLGVNVFSLIFFVMGANLRHSHVPFRYPAFLEKIFMSPYQHQIHHDIRPKYCHSNFGSRLSLWDNIFGTLHLSEELSPEEIKFGLPYGELSGKENTLKNNLLNPFKVMFGIKRHL